MRERLIQKTTQRQKPAAVLEYFSRCVVRRRVSEGYAIPKALPVMKRLSEILKVRLNYEYNGSEKSLRYTLKDFGFM
jgi:hypothetical protein